MLSAWRMVDRKQLAIPPAGHALRRAASSSSRRIAAVAVSVEFCILIGVFLSFVLYVPRAARVHLTELTMTPERVIRERATGAIHPCDRMLHLQPGGRDVLRLGPRPGQAPGHHRAAGGARRRASWCCG